MTTGTLFALLLGLAGLAWVVVPLLAPNATEAERVARVRSAAQELQSRKQMVLATLRDLEEDRETGKLDDEDYEAMHRELTARAVRLMRQIEEAEAPASGPKPA